MKKVDEGESLKKRLMPFILSISIIILDQITKALIVHFIPENTVGVSLMGDFLEIVHVRNTAVAFSIGHSFPLFIKYVLFIVIPLLLMAALFYVVFSKKTKKYFTPLQTWFIAGIFGGGVGNLIDRIFRHLRVVDWISVKFYGLFGMERFPTWNIADGSVVVCVIALLLAFIIEDKKKDK